MTLVKRSNMYLPSFWDNFFSKDLMDWGSSNFGISLIQTGVCFVNIHRTLWFSFDLPRHLWKF